MPSIIGGATRWMGNIFVVSLKKTEAEEQFWLIHTVPQQISCVKGLATESLYRYCLHSASLVRQCPKDGTSLLPSYSLRVVRVYRVLLPNGDKGLIHLSPHLFFA